MRISKEAKAAEKAKRIARLLEYQAILKVGVCPDCGTKLYRNSSMTGWWQCGHVGAVGFQREAGPHCNYQFFYDPSIEDMKELLARATGVQS